MSADNRPPRRARKAGRQEPLRTATLGRVLAELGIHDWDVLLVGDGSGSGWERGCGWSAVLIDHYLGKRKTFHGGMSAGTVTIGEVMPYVHAMSWYSRNAGKARLHDRATSGGLRRVHVHAVTDSETVARQGNDPQELEVRRRTNREWWAALDCIVAMGYQMHWHWVGRDRLGLNMLVDHLSRASRLAVESVSPPEGLTAYDFNPGPPLPADPELPSPELLAGGDGLG